jgi:hypothetical protein
MDVVTRNCPVLGRYSGVVGQTMGVPSLASVANSQVRNAHDGLDVGGEG